MNTTEPCIDMFPRQIRSDENLDKFKSSAMALSELMHTAVILTIVWLWWIKGNPSQLIYGYYTVQLLTYIPLVYDLILPASSVVIVGYFKDLVEFEILNIETMVRWFAPDFSFYTWWSTYDPSLNHKDQIYALFDEWQFWIFFPLYIGLLFAFLKII